MGLLRIPKPCFGYLAGNYGNNRALSNNWLADGNVYNINYNPASYGLNYNLMQGPTKGFTLYKGAVPTQADADAYDSTTATTWLSTTPYVDPRASDALIKWNPASVVLVGSNLCLNFGSIAATQTGQATWFRLIGSWTHGGTTFYYHYCVMLGSVTAIDGGGDIEFPVVDFVSGQNYSIPQVSLVIPTKYSF